MKVKFNGDDVPEPEDDESHGDFMDRCVDEIGGSDEDENDAVDACQQAWEDSKAMPQRTIVGTQHKTHVDEDVSGMEFILSDETVDRIGDVIKASGWELDNFKKNPIAMFNHDRDFPIGKWKDVKIDGTALKGSLVMAPKGTSPRIDEIRALIDAGILRAVSVGFKPIAFDQRIVEGRWAGDVFIKQELLETSLVSVPANPNAISLAKSLKISPATIDLVFAEHGKRDRVVRRGLNGGQADRQRSNGKGRAMSLAQRIVDLQAAIVAKQTKLEEHIGKLDDSNVSDADMQITQDLNQEITQLKKQHTSLIESEKLLGGASSEGHEHRQLIVAGEKKAGTGRESVSSPHVIRSQKKELEPIEYLIRAGVVAYAQKVWGVGADQARVKIYGEDDNTKLAVEWLVRAASAPAMTNVTGWAAELVHQIYADLMPALFPKAIYTRLTGYGLSLGFGRAGKIVIPTRSRTPTIAGSFVGEGNPIPVRQGAFTSQTMTPKKMAVITTWTREMDEYSTPAIEGLLRQAIQEDTSISLDTVLMDSGPATAIRPAGLMNGITPVTATTGGGIAAVVGDIQKVTDALITSLYGNLRSPVWLVNPIQINHLKLIMNSFGEFPFKAEVNAGNINGYPYIDSGTVPAGTMILIDAADFVSMAGDDPRFEVSDQATLHMEDTTPLPLVDVGSPGAVASPQRSLWQTDSLALRLILPTNWMIRRTGTVAAVSSVTW
jgi:HK97 family phage prohead protease